MQANIGAALLRTLKPRQKYYDVWDTKLSGFHIRVMPSGQISYRCRYLCQGVRQFITLGKAQYMTPAQARDKAIDVISKANQGTDPKDRAPRGVPPLCDFIQQDYTPWAISNLKSAKSVINRINHGFVKPFGKLPLDAIVPRRVEKWRIDRVNAGTSPVTVNLDIATFKAALSKAVEWGLIETNPLAKFKKLRVDPNPNIRFLNPDEEMRLRATLDHRENRLRDARESGNQWRKARGYELYPTYTEDDFIDHLKPMILISLNTGLRRGELFILKWRDIDLERKILTIQGENAKSGKTRHLPLNKEALDALTRWKKHHDGSKNDYVFKGHHGKPFDNVRSSWQQLLKEASIQKFRWHDMRHHFASQLVMLGVDLNTVRELLGHSDIKMTLRYAHLAPEHKASAVEKLHQPSLID